MPIAKKILIAYLFIVSAALAGVALPSESRAQELPTQDVVVLVDCSKSAAPYIPAITQILSRFVGGSQYGDSFSCYQFSNNSVLVARMKIEKPGDVAQLRSQLEQLRARGEQTNYSPAIERGMSDIRTSHLAHPANERVLILITDGRRHPDDTKSEKRSFRKLLSEYSGMKAGEDYSFYCFYLGDWFEDDLQAYLLSAKAHLANWPKNANALKRLTIADIHITEPSVFLGDLPEIPAQETFSIVFHPRRAPADVAMIELDVHAGFEQKTLDRYFTVIPRRFICRPERWSERFNLETRGFSRGTYSGAFHFRPSQPEALLLYPRTIDFKFSISGGLRVDIPSSLKFGPVGFKGRYSETKRFSIAPERPGFTGGANSISVTPDIYLPEGIDLIISKSKRDNDIVVEITVSRDRKISAELEGEYEGRLLLASNSEWILSDEEVPIHVDLSDPGVSRQAILVYVLIAALCIGGVILLLVVFKSAREGMLDYLAHRTRPRGKLTVVHDPTRGTASTINLDRLSEKKDTKVVMVGVGPEAHVELSHISMIDKLYIFSGQKEADDVTTIVQAAKTTDEVIVNGMSRTGEVKLRHLDMVKLGAFEFRYEVPRPLRQVVLYYLNGDACQGWLTSWNIDAEGFHFLHREDTKKEAYVRFYELKTVAFVRDFDGELTTRLLSPKAPKSGHRVRLFLSDQEELTGYVLNHRDPGEKFYFFPDSMGDNILFFLIERSTIRNMVLLEEDNRGAINARKTLTEILAVMKGEVAR